MNNNVVVAVVVGVATAAAGDCDDAVSPAVGNVVGAVRDMAVSQAIVTVALPEWFAKHFSPSQG